MNQNIQNFQTFMVWELMTATFSWRSPPRIICPQIRRSLSDPARIGDPLPIRCIGSPSDPTTSLQNPFVCKLRQVDSHHCNTRCLASADPIWRRSAPPMLVPLRRCQFRSVNVSSIHSGQIASGSDRPDPTAPTQRSFQSPLQSGWSFTAPKTATNLFFRDRNQFVL